MNWPHIMPLSGLVILLNCVFFQSAFADWPSLVKPESATKKVDEDGFVRRWLVLEPIRARGLTDSAVQALVKQDAFAALHTGVPRDSSVFDFENTALQWHAVDTKNYNLNLHHFAHGLSKPTSNVLFWIVTVVECPQEMKDVRLAIGSNAASVWWVNGQEVIGIYNDRQTVIDDGVSKRITLRKGHNQVLGAVVNAGGATDFCARFLGADDKPLTTLSVDLGASSGEDPASAESVEATLQDAFKDAFFLGAAGDIPGRYTDEELMLVKTQFNFWTPENCMKPAPIHPREDEWRFERPDALVDWCVENGIGIHGHTLVWHAQTNDWFFHDGDKEQAIQRMKEHIHALVGRYKGRIHSWDVVNEAISDQGDPTTENLRDSGWLKTIGPEFLSLAFQFAHEADPDAVLYYNDYSIERGEKHASSMLLLKRLIDDGAPIHGVGIQGHWSTNSVPFEAVDKAVSNYASLGLKVSITELDVTIRGASGGQFGRGFGRRRQITPPTDEDLKSQAEAYARLFAIFKKHAEEIERVTFWGLHDRRTWRFGQHPLLFDAGLNRKPAYAAILDVASNSISETR